MKTALLSIAALLLAAGCATDPDKISSAYVSPMQYQDYTCRQISEEARRVAARSGEAIGAQKKQADNDAAATAFGVILFWPALFMIDGDEGNATEVARLKGEMEALESASIQKNCGIVFRKAPEKT